MRWRDSATVSGRDYHITLNASCPLITGQVPVDNIPRRHAKEVVLRAACDVVQTNEDTVAQKFGYYNRSETPVWSDGASFDKRIFSYANWPVGIGLSPTELAGAGFIYTGVGDSVYCFHCSGRLRAWRSCHVPWHEHLKWFPECSYIRDNHAQELWHKIQTLCHIVKGSLRNA